MGPFLRFRFLLVILFLGIAGFLGAQDLPAQPFSFRWLPVDGAGGYRAEIQDKSGKLVVNQQVQDEQTSMLVSLVPGSYTLRLTTLNRFLLPEGATDWVPIHVAAPTAPEVGDFPLLALNPGVSAPLTVSIKGLAQDATAALRSPMGTLIPLDLQTPANGTVTFTLPPLTSRGSYSLVVTNPPKLTTSVSGKISVHYPVPVVASLEPKDLQTKDSAQPVQIKGGDFSPETVVTIKAGDTGAPMQLALSTRTSSELTATIPPGLLPGEYQLSVANARDETSVNAGTLTLVAPPPPPPVVQAPPPPPPVVELPPKPVGPPGDPKVEVSTFSVSKNGDFSFPTAIAFKRFGATYVSDTYGNAIRAIYPNGEITTFAGSGKPGSSNGNGGQSAQFNKPTGLVLDSHGNLIVADTGNGLLRRVTPEGLVSTVVTWPGNPRETNSASLSQGLAIDGSDNVYIADAATNSIFEVTSNGKLTTVAGSPKGGALNGSVSKATFLTPQGIAVDATGTLFISDTGNNLIRKITPDGVVTTLAGSGVPETKDGQGEEAGFDSPTGIELAENGVLYVSETNGHRIRRVSADGTVTTVAGVGLVGTSDGPGNQALFNGPRGIALTPDGTLLVVDSVNNSIRKIILPIVETSDAQLAASTWAGNGSASFKNAYGQAAGFNSPNGVAFDAAGNLYVADTGNNCIRKIAVEGTVTTAAGSGRLGSSNGGFFFWDQPSFNHPESVAVGNDGTVFIADTGNHLIRKISPKGELTTLAGSGRYWSVDGNGMQASIIHPRALAVDGFGTVYFVEEGPGFSRIRKVTPEGRVVTLAPTWAPEAGIKSKADFSPSGLAVDSVGTLYVSTKTSPRILRVTPDNRIHILAGSGSPGNQDGRGVSSSFQASGALALDHLGNLYVADTLNHLVRKVTPEGVVTTLGGQMERDPWHFPGGIAVNSDGSVFIADTGSHRIRKLDMSAQNAVPSMTQMVPSNQGMLGFPGSVTSDSLGNLYLIDGNRIVKMAPNGAVSPVAGSVTAGNKDGLGSGALFRAPQALAADASGNLYVVDTDNNSLRMVAPGGAVTTLASGLHHPRGLTVNSEGRIFVADTDARVVLVFTGRDKVRGKKGPPTFQVWASSFEAPRALASDGRNNIWVADGNRIKRIDRSGRVAVVAGSGANGGIDGWGNTTSFSAPAALAADKEGNVYVTDQGYGRIRRVNSEGVVSTLDGIFDYPTGIAVDPSGRLWVCDALKQKLQALVPEGVPPSSSLMVSPTTDSVPQGLARRTIDFNGGLKEWAGITPNLRVNPLEFWPSIPGTSPRAFYMAQDDKYFYWMMTLTDGRPRGLDEINYALEIFQNAGDKQATAKIDGWTNYAQPILIYGNARSAQWQDLWRNGRAADRAMGDGFIEARFPLARLKTIFSTTEPYRIFVHIYRAADNVPFSEGPRLGWSSVQF